MALSKATRGNRVLKNLFGTKAKTIRDRMPTRYQLRLEALEDRLAPAVITVTGTGDDIALDGVVTLREAIMAANTNEASGDAAPGTIGLDTINFNIPTADAGYNAATGAWSIKPTSNLPVIGDNVTIDGYSQPGASPNTLANGDNAVLKIELNGRSLDSDAVGLELQGSSITVRGLVVNNFFTETLDDTRLPIIRGFGLLVRNRSNVVEGNFIGTDVSGTIAQPNGFAGVLVVASSSGTRIGGTTAAARNLISGNTRVGLWMSSVSGSLVQGNFIGTDITGAAPLGSYFGVTLDQSANNIIGGTSSGTGNVIAFNRLSGIEITYLSRGNAVRGNSIFANDGLGIDLQSDGAGVPNDPGDADVGGNNLQNFPILASAVSTGGTTTITGALNSVAGKLFYLDFYASPEADPAGYGEGKTYLGAAIVTTDYAGNSSFTVTFPVAIAAGQLVSATATTADTAPYGDTSMFSPVVEVTSTTPGGGATNRPPVLNPIGNKVINEGSTLTFTASATDPDAGQTLTYSLEPGAQPGSTIDPDTGVFSWLASDGVSSAQFTVRVRDNRTPQGSDAESFTVTVNNVAPTVSIGGNTSLGNGGTLIRLGSFADPGADTWTGIVNYGDGSGDQPLILGANKTILLSHNYATGGTYTVTVSVTDDDNGAGSASFQVTMLTPPGVEDVVINDGDDQRSMVNSLTVTLDGLVTIDPGAFELKKQNGKLIGLNVSTSVVGGHTEATLTFFGNGIVGGSLADGNYTLVTRADRIRDAVGQMVDGNGDGLAGGNRLDKFFRLYGDTDGDHDVDGRDYLLFQRSYRSRTGQLSYLSYLDFDGDGRINSTDLAQFLRRGEQG